MTPRLPRLAPVAFTLCALLALAVTTFGGSARAQSASPAASPATMDMNVAHPAHIHSGSCPNPGPIVYPLNDVIAPGMPMTMMGTPVMGTPMAVATPMAPANGTPVADLGPVVAQSVTTVKVALADLEKAPYAVNVHLSLPQISTYIDCGDITGDVSTGSLTIQLNELNSSGLVGTAMLVDNGDGTTTVTVVLRHKIG